MTESKTSSDAPKLADRLREVQVGIRSDLTTSRHVFRGEVTYVIQDPLTFQSHSLSLEDYQILVRIHCDKKLGDVFNGLIEEECLDPEDEELFYQFVISLHQLGFLNLPISDNQAIYRRYLSKQRANRIKLLMGVFFLQIPVWNPDAF